MKISTIIISSFLLFSCTNSPNDTGTQSSEEIAASNTSTEEGISETQQKGDP